MEKLNEERSATTILNLCGLENNERSEYIFWSVIFLLHGRKMTKICSFLEPIAGPYLVKFSIQSN